MNIVNSFCNEPQAIQSLRPAASGSALLSYSVKKKTEFCMQASLDCMHAEFLLAGESSDSEVPEREQAMALLMAGRHLPDTMMHSSEDRVGLIKEASRMYEALGDKKSVQACRKTLLEMDSCGQTNEILMQC